MTDPSCHLGGIGILITRPAQQADDLCELIEAMHGRPIRFPALEINPAEDAAQARRLLQQAVTADLLIFVSANAVDYAYPLLPDTLPADLQIAAIGSATARKLSALGLEPGLVPDDQYDSEGLLRLGALQNMQGKRVVVVRGNGGRPLLGDALTERGASVTYVEVYRRSIPQRNPANLITGWGKMVDVVVATSNGILDNLFTLFGDAGRSKLQNTPLLVISGRMAEHARELGCRKILLSENATDQAIVEALCSQAGGQTAMI